jgi:nitroreductase
MSMATSPAFADQVLALMKSRRVCRVFTDEPVSDEHLRTLTEAARWATSGGNRHLHKFLIVRDPDTIRRVRSVSPGMQALPPAMIVILTDLEVAARESLQMDHDHANWMDVGTAAMNMMNMAHALGIGTCPVTSFSRSGASVMLDLPPHLIPGVDSHRRPPETTGARPAGRCAETPAGTSPHLLGARRSTRTAATLLRLSSAGRGSLPTSKR